MEQLKPCPLCRGESIMHSCSLNYLGEYEGEIECQGCRTTFRLVGTGGVYSLQMVREKITEKWNTRADDPIMIEPLKVQLTDEVIEEMIKMHKNQVRIIRGEP